MKYYTVIRDKCNTTLGKRESGIVIFRNLIDQLISSSSSVLSSFSAFGALRVEATGPSCSNRTAFIVRIYSLTSGIVVQLQVKV